uniref:Major facilitator superfamily (MFS) profile domain-containing protein n=1 Tax=Ditylenchus dipsaci TaxID=166011 RepID=A0A915ETH7_9BILA
MVCAPPELCHCLHGGQRSCERGQCNQFYSWHPTGREASPGMSKLIFSDLLMYPVQSRRAPSNLFSSSNSKISNKSQVPGEFLWSKHTQGSLLSAFFWGYLTSQVLGGYLAARIGPKLVIGVCLTLSSLITLFSPLAARLNVPAFFILRVLLGFAQGGLVPAMQAMWSAWAPPMERSVLTGISYSGAQIGNFNKKIFEFDIKNFLISGSFYNRKCASDALSGYLCNYGMDGGWPSIFYVLGGAGLLWCVLWFVFVADTPQKHKNIAIAEREYIVESLGGTANTSKTSKKVPIKAILTSPAVWACFVGHFAGDWGAYTMATSLPSFMNDVLGLDLTSMGLVSSVPYVAYFVVINVGGFTADKLQHSGILSTVNTRRLAMLVALIGQALFLVLIGYCGCGQELLVIGLLIVSVGISGFQYAGFAVNYLDICPAYVGTVMGIGNTMSCIAGVFSPLIMGWLTPTGSKEEWQHVFLVTGLILVVGAAFFSVFASGHVQPWAIPPQENGEDGEATKKRTQKNLPEALSRPLIKTENGETDM